MLFNSYVFILAFLPATWLGWWLLRASSIANAPLIWLTLASLVFYGYWSPAALVVLSVSLAVNLAIGRLIYDDRHGRPQLWLAAGVAFNVGLIAYYKYINFLIANLGWFVERDLGSLDVVLPIGISFFTFQQIAWLVDLSRGEGERPSLVRHTLFITFFPQVIAGPIVHHKEMMPQFDRPATNRRRSALSEDLAIGLTIFAIGLAKKVLIADTLSPIAGPAFAAADAGETVAFLDAWLAALAYTGQIYFDFSGYSDMAIGIARLFGIRLPLNFASPYKARSIAEFWRRWHMTLSRFLRDYIYIPLGGSRHGSLARTRNLMLTMLLGGLWHGANWTFVVWGGLHGLYLVINHLWSSLTRRIRLPAGIAWPLGLLGWALTFFAVVGAWVVFRAAKLDGAMTLLSAMSGRQGFGSAIDPQACALVAAALLIAFVAPNTQEIMARWRPATDALFVARAWWQWRPTPAWGLAASVVLLAGLIGLGTTATEFLYFQF